MKKVGTVIFSFIFLLLSGLGGYYLKEYVLTENLNEEVEKKEEVKNNNDNNTNNVSENSSKIEIEKSYIGKLTTIEISELKEKVDNEDNFVILYSQTFCSHCKNMKKAFESVLEEYKIEIYVLEINLLTEDERTYLNSVIEDSISGTPALCFYEKGTEVLELRSRGEKNSEDIKNILNNNIVLK